MSSTASTSKATETTPKTANEQKSEATQHLGVLEEDDEFEEFAAAGPSCSPLATSDKAQLIP
jgi:26 proteasome complex subunit DSS1